MLKWHHLTRRRCSTASRADRPVRESQLTCDGRQLATMRRATSPALVRGGTKETSRFATTGSGNAGASRLPPIAHGHSPESRGAELTHDQGDSERGRQTASEADRRPARVHGTASVLTRCERPPGPAARSHRSADLDRRVVPSVTDGIDARARCYCTRGRGLLRRTARVTVRSPRSEKRPSGRSWPVRKLSKRCRRELELAHRRPGPFQRKSREPPHRCRLSLRRTACRVQHSRVQAPRRAVRGPSRAPRVLPERPAGVLSLGGSG